MNKLKWWFPWVCLAVIGIGGLMADSISNMETIDGAQRNRLQQIINAAISATGAGGNGTFTNATSSFTGNFVSTNGVDLSVTNYLSMINLYATTNVANNWINFVSSTGTSLGTVRPAAGNGLQIITGGSGADFSLNNDSSVLTMMAGNYVLGLTTFTVANTIAPTFNGITQVNSNFLVNANTTLGDAPADSVTFNANTATVVGQLNFNQNTFSITNGSVLLGAATPPANLVAKMYVNGNIRADNYMYNILSPTYSATGTNSIDFSTNMVVNITGVTAGLTLTSANLLAGRSVDVIFQGTTSNIILTLPTGWIPVSPTFSAVVTNKYVVLHAMALGSTDSTVLYSITQQP